MRIKQGTTAYNQLKRVMEVSREHYPEATPESYAKQGYSLTRFLWDMFWFGSSRLGLRLISDSWNVREGDNSQIVILNCNDDHITTALKHIWNSF